MNSIALYAVIANLWEIFTLIGSLPQNLVGKIGIQRGKKDSHTVYSIMNIKQAMQTWQPQHLKSSHFTVYLHFCCGCSQRWCDLVGKHTVVHLLGITGEAASTSNTVSGRWLMITSSRNILPDIQYGLYSLCILYQFATKPVHLVLNDGFKIRPVWSQLSSKSGMLTLCEC